MIRLTQEVGDGGANVGGNNTGTIAIGLSFAEHETALLRREVRIRDDLERAHVSEKAAIRAELTAVADKLSNVEADYRRTLEELAGIKAKLQRFDNQIGEAERNAAYDALDRGDRSIADALFAALETKAQERANDALAEAAEMAFERGKIAEQEIRWFEAADHYSRAAQLAPNYDRLYKANEFAWRAGRHAEAASLGEALLGVAKREHGEKTAKTASALQALAASYRALNRKPKPKDCCSRRSKLIKSPLANSTRITQPTSTRLALCSEQWAVPKDAEPLLRRAVEVDRATSGDPHPAHATRLNTLGALLRATGRCDEAEPLLRQAIAIDRVTIGEKHPDHAVRLVTLGALLREVGRRSEAEKLLHQAKDTIQTTLGEKHPIIRAH